MVNALDKHKLQLFASYNYFSFSYLVHIERKFKK